MARGDPAKPMGYSTDTASTSGISHPAPRCASTDIVSRADLPTSAAVDRHLRSAERLAWLHASVTVLRKGSQSYPYDICESDTLYVALHRNRLVERASKDVDLEQ